MCSIVLEYGFWLLEMMSWWVLLMYWTDKNDHYMVALRLMQNAETHWIYFTALTVQNQKAFMKLNATQLRILVVTLHLFSIQHDQPKVVMLKILIFNVMRVRTPQEPYRTKSSNVKKFNF